MKRHALRVVLRILIGILVAAQLSVAAYACAGLSMVQLGTQLAPASVTMAVAGDATLAADMAAMPDCQDTESCGELTISNLCLEHCRFGQQGDLASTVSVPTANLLQLVGLPWQRSGAIPASLSLPSAHATAARLSDILAATPCNAIRHCVRRT